MCSRCMAIPAGGAELEYDPIEGRLLCHNCIAIDALSENREQQPRDGASSEKRTEKVLGDQALEELTAALASPVLR